MPPGCELINLISSLTSLIVSIFAGALAVTFFLSAKKSEIEAAKILSSINDRVDTLSVINNDLLKSAMKHISDSHSKVISEAFNTVKSFSVNSTVKGASNERQD